MKVLSEVANLYSTFMTFPDFEYAFTLYKDKLSVILALLNIRDYMVELNISKSHILNTKIFLLRK